MSIFLRSYFLSLLSLREQEEQRNKTYLISSTLSEGEGTPSEKGTEGSLALPDLGRLLIWVTWDSNPELIG